MLITPLPPNRPTVIDAPLRVMEYQPTMAIDAPPPLNRGFTSRVSALWRWVSNLWMDASAEREALLKKLSMEPKTVGRFYDAWNNERDKATQDLLKEVDVSFHKRNATFDPQAVFALSFLRAAGHAGAGREMRRLEVFEIASIARTNPQAVFALTHLKKAGNTIAWEMMTRMDVARHAQEAEKNPFAVYALSHLANAGNKAALDAMRKLPIEGLVEKIGSDEHALRAINALTAAKNESALVVAISYIPGVNKETIRAKIEAARRDPLALIDAVYMMQDLGPEARDLIRMLNISELRINTSTMSYEDKWTLIDTLEELTAIGNESAFALLCRASRNNAWAVWVLDKLKFRHHNIDVAEAMANLDVSLYAGPARTAPGVVFALQLLANEMNTDAIEIMRDLDPSGLISQASSFRDPEAAKAALNAVEALARYDNAAANEWLRTRPKNR